MLFGAIVGTISSKFVTKALQAKEKRKKFRNHIVICNWNANGAEIIRQLQKIKQDQEIIVIAEDYRNDELPANGQLYIRQDDPTKYEVLKANYAQTSRTVILLADANEEKPDDKNAVIALAIKLLEEEAKKNARKSSSMLKQEGKQDVHVLAELIDQQKRRHLTRAGVDEFICVGGLAAGMIAQSALHPLLPDVYERILQYSEHTNEIYFLFNAEPDPNNLDKFRDPVPEWLIGKSFNELVEYTNHYRKNIHNSEKNRITLLGFKHHAASGNAEKIELNPSAESRISENDSLICMAFTLEQARSFGQWLQREPFA